MVVVDESDSMSMGQDRAVAVAVHAHAELEVEDRKLGTDVEMPSLFAFEGICWEYL